MAETQRGTKSGFSAEERAAMKAAAAERKASQKQEDLDKAMAEAIAKLPDDERKMAEKIDAIVRERAPMLASKTYYGMPALARDGKVCVFIQPASKFNAHYSTIGFDPRREPGRRRQVADLAPSTRTGACCSTSLGSSRSGESCSRPGTTCCCFSDGFFSGRPTLVWGSG